VEACGDWRPRDRSTHDLAEAERASCRLLENGKVVARVRPTERSLPAARGAFHCPDAVRGSPTTSQRWPGSAQIPAG